MNNSLPNHQITRTPRFQASSLLRFLVSLFLPFLVSSFPRFLVSSFPRFLLSSLPCLLALLFAGFAASGCTAPVRVEWSTETEMNTAGFNLFRGESADGPFGVKVNEQLIPPSTDPMTGGNYQYVDRTARPGVTYYYRLEEVERNGGTNSFGPISVRAGGLAWWHGLVLVVLAAVAVALWLLGGRREARRRGKGGGGGETASAP